MYVDVWNRSEMFRNLKFLQGLMPDYNDQTKGGPGSSHESRNHTFSEYLIMISCCKIWIFTTMQ